MPWNTITEFGARLVVPASKLNAARENLNYLHEWFDGSNTDAITVAAATTLSGVVTFSAAVGSRPTFANGFVVSANGYAVTGNSTITGDLTVSGTVTAVMGVNGTWNTLTATTTIEAGTSLTVGTTITAGGALTVNAGGAAITGNSTVTGTLGVTGATTLGSLTVTGAVTLEDTLHVTGALTGSAGAWMSEFGSLEVYGNFTGGRPIISLGMYGEANTTPGLMQFRKSRGARSSPVGTNDGDMIVDFTAQGYTGTQWKDAATIRLETVGANDADQMPGQLRVLLGLPAGGAVTTLVERLRITNAGRVGVNDSDPDVYTLSVRGDGAHRLIVDSSTNGATSSLYLGALNSSDSDPLNVVRVRGVATNTNPLAVASEFRVGVATALDTFSDEIIVQSSGSIILGRDALIATDATDGFLYIRSGNGAPTGAPTIVSSHVPLYFDHANDKLYVFNDGSWLGVTLT